MAIQVLICTLWGTMQCDSCSVDIGGGGIVQDDIPLTLCASCDRKRAAKMFGSIDQYLANAEHSARVKVHPVNIDRRVLGYPSYGDYINSPSWFLIRERIKERDGHRCVVCNAIVNLSVHHRTYERCGHEYDSDLTTLCRNCHWIYHSDEVPRLERSAAIGKDIAEAVARGSAEAIAKDRAGAFVRNLITYFLIASISILIGVLAGKLF